MEMDTPAGSPFSNASGEPSSAERISSDRSAESLLTWWLYARIACFAVQRPSRQSFLRLGNCSPAEIFRSSALSQSSSGGICVEVCVSQKTFMDLKLLERNAGISPTARRRSQELHNLRLLRLESTLKRSKRIRLDRIREVHRLVASQDHVYVSPFVDELGIVGPIRIGGDD